MTTQQPVHEAPGQPVGDDFTQIRGIGPGIAHRLHNAGILRFTQLASLSPEEIVAAIGDLIGLTVERVEQQDWAGQARELSEIRYEPITDENGGHLHYATFTAELLLDEDNRVRRTRLVDVRAGNEDAWAGWDAERMTQFFTQHAGLHADVQSADKLAMSGTASPADAVTEIEAKELAPDAQSDMEAAGVVALDPPAVDKVQAVQQPGELEINRLDTLNSQTRLNQRVLPSDLPFTLSLILNLAQTGLLTEPELHLKATIQAKEISTGKRVLLAEWDEVHQPREDFDFSLQYPGLPTGIYRMEAAAVVHPVGREIPTSMYFTAFLEGEILQVF